MSEPEDRHPSRHEAERAAAADARARLDQMREEAGMPLRGDELAARSGAPASDSGDPPLDWRLTPKNIVFQLAAIAIFAAVVWFLGSLVFDNVSALLAHYGS